MADDASDDEDDEDEDDEEEVIEELHQPASGDYSCCVCVHQCDYAAMVVLPFLLELAAAMFTAACVSSHAAFSSAAMVLL